MPCRAVDSTGIKAEGEGEWDAHKHGGSKRRRGRKIHIGIEEETLEVWAVEVAISNIGDAPIPPELLDQIPPDQHIGSVTADGAYDTRRCHDATAARSAHAIIPPRKNVNSWKPTSAGAIARDRALCLLALHRHEPPSRRCGHRLPGNTSSGAVLPRRLPRHRLHHSSDV